MGRVKYLKYNGRMIPTYIFNEDMTMEQIAEYLESNREWLVSYLCLPILDDDEFHVHKVDEHYLCVGNDDEWVDVEVDWTNVIQKDWT